MHADQLLYSTWSKKKLSELYKALINSPVKKKKKIEKKAEN
jgi:hypothetical protein